VLGRDAGGGLGRQHRGAGARPGRRLRRLERAGRARRRPGRRRGVARLERPCADGLGARDWCGGYGGVLLGAVADGGRGEVGERGLEDCGGLMRAG